MNHAAAVITKIDHAVSQLEDATLNLGELDPAEMTHHEQWMLACRIAMLAGYVQQMSASLSSRISDGPKPSGRGDREALSLARSQLVEVVVKVGALRVTLASAAESLDTIRVHPGTGESEG